MEKLSVPGRRFISIDLKLKAALSAIAVKDIHRQLIQAMEAKKKRTLKGRKALLLAYRHYDTMTSMQMRGSLMTSAT